MIRVNRGITPVAKAVTNKRGKSSLYVKKGSAPKYNIRTSMVLTTSQSLGTGYRVGKYGSVHVLLTEELKQFFLDTQGEAVYVKLRNLWKSTKNDGAACFIRDTTLLKATQKNGVKINGRIPRKVEDLYDIQARIAGQKGMLEVLPSDVMDAIGYKEYDIMVEENSWKYQYCKLYDDVLELNLLNAASDKFTSRLNYQYVNALDGITSIDAEGNKFIDTVKTNKQYQTLVDDFYSNVEGMLNGENEAELFELLRIMGGFDISKKKKEIAIKGMEFTAEENDEVELVNKLANVVSVVGVDALKDDWCREQFFKIIKGKKDSFTGGNIPVKGASRYVLSDIVASLRTDLKAVEEVIDGQKVLTVDNEIVAVYNGKKYIAKDDTMGTSGEYSIRPGDIVITKMDQTALRGNMVGYWGNAPEVCRTLLMRTPCTHPGEPQVVDMLNRTCLEQLPEFVEMKNGYRIPVRKLYANKKNVIVLSIFNAILDALGGADTDGDRINAFQDQRIVEMRADERKICIVEAGNNDNPDSDLELNWEAFSCNMRRALRNSGTGRLTNLDTFWRDAQHALQWIKATKHKGLNLDAVMKGVPTILFEAINVSIISAKEMMSDTVLCDRIKRNSINNYNLLKYTATLKPSKSIKEKELDTYINLLDRYMEMLKEFQEAAIAAPKTGNYLDFDLIKYLDTQYKAGWHKPGADEEYLFTGMWTHTNPKTKKKTSKFMTPMAAIYYTSKDRWNQIAELFGKEEEKVANEDEDLDFAMMDSFDPYMFDEYEERVKPVRSRFDIPLDNLNKAGYEDASQEIIKINRNYSALLEKISKYREDKEIYNQKFDEVKTIIRGEIIKTVEECGFEETMAASYHPFSRGEEYFTAKSFVWVLIFDEFMTYLSNQLSGRKLIPLEEAISKNIKHKVVTSNDNEYALIELEQMDEKEHTMMLAKNAIFKMTLSTREFNLTHNKIRKMLERNNNTITITKDDKGLTVMTDFLNEDGSKTLKKNLNIGFLVKEDSNALKSFMINKKIIIEEMTEKATNRVMQFRIKYMA